VNIEEFYIAVLFYMLIELHINIRKTRETEETIKNG